MLLHPNLVKGTLSQYCGLVKGTTQGGFATMFHPTMLLPCSIWTPHITPRMRNESSQMVPTWYCGTFSISKDMHCTYPNINWIWTCELRTFCMSLEAVHASRKLLEMKGINQACKKNPNWFFWKGHVH